MSMVFCRGCGKEIHESAPVCPHCGAPQKIQPTAINSLPQKIEEPIPDGIKGWSWGAFLLNWIWAIGNKTWIGLLALIPYVGLIMAIVLGFKGREWAWKNKQWDSVEHFNRVQKKWSYWGVMIVVVVFVIGIVAAIAIPAYKSYQDRAEAAAYSQQVEAERLAEIDRQSALLAEQESNEARQAEQQAEPLQSPSAGTEVSKFGSYEWQSFRAQGITRSSAQDDNGNGLFISCSEDNPVSALATIGGKPYASDAIANEVPFDVVVDGVLYSNPFLTDCRVCANNFDSFWAALRKANNIKVVAEGNSASIPTNKIASVLLELSSKENSCNTGW